jgi:hypothetical protein
MLTRHSHDAGAVVGFSGRNDAISSAGEDDVEAMAVPGVNVFGRCD